MIYYPTLSNAYFINSLYTIHCSLHLVYFISIPFNDRLD